MNTQTVPHPANRFDAVAVSPQPATQSGNLDIDRPFRRHVAAAGETGEDLLAAKCLARMAGQQPQESKFRNGQSDRPVADPHLVPLRVYRDAVHPDSARTRLPGPSRASQQGSDLAEKQLIVNRVCHVVVRAQFQCCHNIRLVKVIRRKDQRQVSRRPVELDFAADIKTGHVAEPQVDEDQINVSGSGQRQSLPTCRSGHDIDTGRIQGLAVLLSDPGVRVYYKYANAGH